MITDLAHFDVRLFHDFAAHRLFDGFPLVDEPGQGRIGASAPAAGATEQALIVVVHQHDGDRVRTRKMVCAASVAQALLAA